MAKPYSKAASTRHAAREEKPVKQRKPINKVSAKLKEGNKIYAKEKKKYIEAFPFCEMPNCNKWAETIHHKKGRIGALLYNPEYFFACCMEHHIEIERNPEKAKENGYSISRL